MKIEKLEFRLANDSMTDQNSAIINRLIDKINELIREVNSLKISGLDDNDDGPGEIGWDNGEFYK